MNYYFLLNTKREIFNYFFLTTSLAVCSIYLTPENKSLIAELHKNVHRITFKNMHDHIGVLITGTILSNTLNAKRKILNKQYYQLHHQSSPLHGNGALRGSHLSPLLSFANTLHLQQLCPHLLFNIWLLSVAHRWKVNLLCTTLLSWGCNTALSEGTLLYLCTFLLAISKKEVARTFPNLCLTLTKGWSYQYFSRIKTCITEVTLCNSSYPKPVLL